MTALRTSRPSVADAREQLVGLHGELVRYGLVVWTAGNVSARAAGADGTDVLVIKPSGVSYDELTAGAMIVCDLDGRVLAGDRAPSSDTAAHAYAVSVDALYERYQHVYGQR